LILKKSVKLSFFLWLCSCSSLIENEQSGLLRSVDQVQKSGNVHTAISMYHQLLEKTKANKLPVYLKLGKAYQQAGDLEASRRTYEEALAYDQDDQVKFELARCYVLAGKPTVALPILKEITSFPHKAQLHNLKGVAYCGIEDFTQAEKEFQMALQESPQDPEIISNLALTLALNKNGKKAIEILRPIAGSVLAKHKQKNNLALVYALDGQFEKAREILKQTVGKEGADRNLTMLEPVIHSTDLPAIEKQLESPS